MNDRISREELVKIYDIEISFFDSLEESGLLQVEHENETKYLRYDDLSAFEKFSNWHYDLDVNLPGLEIIHQLITKLENMQNENKKLSRYIIIDDE